MRHHDYVLVGSGLYAGVFAWYVRKNKKTCPALEKRDRVGGNIHCEDVEGIYVHKYGVHILHTSNKKVREFVNSFVESNRYTNSPVANFRGEMYNMFFNMNTFGEMWGISTLDETKAVTEKQRVEVKEDTRSLEEQAISLVGRELYKKLIRGYTEKQWGRDCRELPAFTIKRTPVRYTYDNNCSNNLYQGVPISGCNVIMEKLFEGYDIETGVDYPENREHYSSLDETIVYTGITDAPYDYRFGKLEYRSLRLEFQVLGEENHQGVAIINYTDRGTPYTRMIKYKHSESGSQPEVAIIREYPASWQERMEPYYSVNDQKNQELSCHYEKPARVEGYVWSGGRLGEYKYYDMGKIIESVMERVEEISG